MDTRAIEELLGAVPSIQSVPRLYNMNCSRVKREPGLLENLYILQNVLYVRYIHLAKAKPIHKRQTHPLIREDVT
jgi:hypothetical protein